MTLLSSVNVHIWWWVGKAWHVTVNFSFQNFYFNIREKYICFYPKWCYESFSVGPEVLGWFFQKWLVIMDLCRSTHTSFLVSMATKWYIFEKLNGGNQGRFSWCKASWSIWGSNPTAGLIRTSHYQEMNNCSVRISYSYFYLRFCKRSNNLLKFSQDSINLELIISSWFVFLGQLGQQSHRWTLLNPI